MPEIGEIRKSKEIGKKGSPSNNFIWQGCIDCGKERWVQLENGEPKSKRCISCAKKKDPRRLGSQNNNWKGGRVIDGYGYAFIKLQPNDFFYSMTDHRGYVREHRLVVAKALGRCLHLWEIVHHKHGFARDDNRYPETLQLVSDDRHKQITILERRIKRLEDRLDEQSKEIRLLHWQLKERDNANIK